MADDFYAQLKDRIAMHAMKDFSRTVESMQPRKVKKPLTNTQRHYRWLENFKQKYGMSYEEYKRKVKAGEMAPLRKAAVKSKEPTASPEMPTANT